MEGNGGLGIHALLTSGTVTLNPRSMIGSDAKISASTVASSSHVTGNLSVRSQTFADSINLQIENRIPSIVNIFEMF